MGKCACVNDGLFLPQQQQYYVQDKVFIGMDHAPESFKLLDRLSGPGVSNKIYRVRRVV